LKIWLSLRRFSLCFSCIALCVSFFLASCHTSTAPVVYRQQPLSEKINYHIVLSGETLFSIAWRYEVDVKMLAEKNGVSSVDKIYAGQKLLLNFGKHGASQSPLPAPSNAVQLSAPNNSAQRNTKASPSFSSNLRWRWPVRGEVSRKFTSSRLFKGIDIDSWFGAPVHAAAPGVVVYAGNGLRGYGQLIIIKHNSVFLSAYAHNKKIFVKEGQLIKDDQKISEAGGDGANKKRLYFEIRRKGKPVDPLRYLP